MNNIKTRIFILLTVLSILFPNFNATVGWGESISLGDFNEGLTSGMPLGFDKILDDLGVDKAELRYSIQTMNVFRQKKTAPSVSVTFNPSNPAPGEKVTAVAIPLYFLNDAKNMYFTWFLKSESCDRANNPSAEERKKCDHDGDGRVDIDDYKIKAARIIASSNFEWETEDYESGTDSDGYKAITGGDDQKDKNNHCFLHDVVSGDEYEIGCAHLFADSPGHTTGDGSFGVGEEKFWRTDPNSNDTAGTGNGDEANIAGLGITSFSWNYEEGDQVGVVVEGVSFEPTHAQDSSYRTMWAATKNLCGQDLDIDIDYPKTDSKTISVTEDTPMAGQTTTITETTTEDVSDSAANIGRISATIVTTTTVTDSVTGAQISQSSTSSTSYSIDDISDDISIDGIEDATDLNDCLYDSLITPAEGGGAADRLNVSLSYFPENPLNDPGEDTLDGDTLTIHAALTNAKDPKFAHYTWQVYESDEINPESWGNPILKSELPDATQSIGLNLTTFKFRLNFERPRKYLKVKLNVSENAGSGIERKGYDDIVIPIQSSSDKIRAYSANISDSLDLSLGNYERCADETEINICPVAKNEIIGIRFSGSGYSDYVWTIDGAPFAYNNESGEGSISFFPANKNNGEKISIGLSAADLRTGEKINLTKLFEVTEPEIAIISADAEVCGPVMLGNYIDIDGKAWPDYSDNNFWAISGKQIKLKAQTSGFKANSSQVTWYVDNTSVLNSDESAGIGLSENGILSLPSKPVGESYSISASALYAPDNLSKQALNKYWGLGYGQFYEKTISDNINIEMREGAEITAQAKNKKIIAALFASLPSYVAFLLRIVLTAFIILVGSTWLMSFFPNLKNEN